MLDRHVHWVDDGADSEEDGGAVFIPPSPMRAPSISLTDTDDSIVDSPPPLTPLSTSGSSPHNHNGFHYPFAIRNSSTRAHCDAQLPHIRSHNAPSHFGDSSPAHSTFQTRMTTLARALPSLIPSPRKPYNTDLPGFPHLSRSTAALHSLLAYTADPRVPVLLWDMRFSPSAETLHMSSAASTASPVPVPLILLHSPATDPPQREMRIHCVGHDIWQPLVVSTHVERTPNNVGSRSPKSVPPAPARNTPDTPEYVTVLHVLRAMHNYLQKGVSGAEYEALGALPTPGLQTAVARAFHERSSETEDSRIIPRRPAPESRARSYHSPPSHQGSTSPTIFGAVIDAESVVRKSGLQRLDCLLGQSRFLGLCHVENEPNVYYIRVDSSR